MSKRTTLIRIYEIELEIKKVQSMTEQEVESTYGEGKEYVLTDLNEELEYEEEKLENYRDKLYI